MNGLYRFIKASALFIAISLAITSCGGSDDDDPIITPEVPSAPTGNKYLSRLEVPKLEAGNIFIQHSAKIGADSVMTYCLEYNPEKFHSRWVAFRFDADTRSKNTKRPDVDPFQDDPLLKNSQTIGYGGFGKKYVDELGISRDWGGKSSQFDRGHICASADRLYDIEANNQTFYMTNMSPQLGDFNQGYWNAFELYVQDIGRKSSFADTLYVVKGGTIRDKETMGHILRNNGAKVVIPKHYFMALLAVKGSDYKAIGFYMEHKEYGFKYGSDVKKDQMSDKIVSIDELEKLTGIDFFHNLPDAIENKVEASSNPSEWEF